VHWHFSLYIFTYHPVCDANVEDKQRLGRRGTVGWAEDHYGFGI